MPAFLTELVRAYNQAVILGITRPLYTLCSTGTKRMLGLDRENEIT